jgi:branched-chain amino acid transport system permease protein
MRSFLSLRDLVIKNWIFIIILLGLLIPLITSDQYILHILILSFILATLGASWDMLAGYGGLFSFGHQAFYAIGGYASAIICINYGISPWLGLLIGGLSALLASLVISYPVLRLRGPYIALVTLAFSLVIYEAITIFRDLTGGPSGLWGIPTFTPIDLGIIKITFEYTNRTSYYYLAYALLIINLIFLKIFVESKYGLRLRVIKESEEVAETLGIDTIKYKLVAVLISAFISGLTGAFYAHYIQLLSPEVAWISTMLDIVLATMLGGFMTIYGAFAGSLVISFLKEYFRVIGQLRLVIYGLILILIIIATPSGLLKEMIAKILSFKKKVKVKNV